ncbi:MAG: response regulator [bacterium]
MEKNAIIMTDNEHAHKMYYDLLERKGYKIFTAPFSNERLDTLRELPFDLILLDIGTESQGIEVLKTLKEQDIRTKIIMISSRDDRDLEWQARLNGAYGILPKEKDPERLSESFDRILGVRLDAAGGENDRILIVDDEIKICSMLEHYLINHRLSPVIATSGEEGIEKARMLKPVMVLLDVNMPGMNGLMALKKIKEIDDRIGVIMITGVEDEAIAKQAMKLGALDYILKPIEFEYLEMCLLTGFCISTASHPAGSPLQSAG